MSAQIGFQKEQINFQGGQTPKVFRALRDKESN